MADESAQAVQPQTGSQPMVGWADERAKVDDWRLGQLLGFGYSLDDASALAVRSDIDLHQAIDLVSGGCAPAVAARILL